ncbi:hypothetical protein MPSEU_000609900 [Mayamaea pseudoterrestris]|nr:hypothetical protein MPSEU_000609900 [Mayamaea pseudoterrestris]
MSSNFTLTIGSALIAFGPFLSVFGLIIYQKSQLVIVVTSAAFVFLALGALPASLCWFVLDKIGLGGALSAVLPGVFFQFIARCVFVAVYHKVEAVIQQSVEKQQAEAAANTQQSVPTEASVRATAGGRRVSAEAHSNWAEMAKLKLQLNDASCGIAAGCGFGGMHAIMLYGTLLASEATNNGGVLYQPSCPALPTLVISAIYAFCFFVMDIFWMLFTFFGMRRRLMFHRGDADEDTPVRVGGWFGNSRHGGNLALLLCLSTHLAASLMTMANYFSFGCTVSLPLVGVVLLITAYVFWAGIGRIYMPPPLQSNHRATERVATRNAGLASTSFHED